MTNFKLQRKNLVSVAVFMLFGAMISCDNRENEPKSITVENVTALTQVVFADETVGKSDITFVTTGAWISTITERTSKSAEEVGVPAWISINPENGDEAGSYTVVLNAANEALVKLFLDRKISFLDIQNNIEKELIDHKPEYDLDIYQILELDKMIKEKILREKTK